MRKFTETWQEVVEKFQKGENITAPTLGGISPGYELCIQALLWSLLSKWPKDKKMHEPDGKNYPREWEEFSEPIIGKLDEKYHFSGAQVGAAKVTAYQFIKFGYSEMMNKLEDDRHMILSKADFGVRFPNID